MWKRQLFGGRPLAHVTLPFIMVLRTVRPNAIKSRGRVGSYGTEIHAFDCGRDCSRLATRSIAISRIELPFGTTLSPVALRSTSGSSFGGAGRANDELLK